MREVLSQSDAHYQHAERPLEVLVRPRIEEPCVLAWVPGQEVLVVATRTGAVHIVEPSFGTREWGRISPDPVAVLVDGARLVSLSRTGLLELWDWPGGQRRWQKQTPLAGAAQLTWWRGGVAAVGPSGLERKVAVYSQEGRTRVRARVPARAALGATGDGHLLLARSTAEGLGVSPFGRPLPEGEPTEHILRFGLDLSVVGVAVGGATVWHVPGGPPVNVKLFEVTVAALTSEGDTVAMGTRSGGVAVADARVGSGDRVRPAKVEGHDSAILALEFSTRGRWLASAAERCIVWGY